MKKIIKKPTQQYRCVHTRAQKFWGWTALIMLFTCGIMVGLGINGNPNRGSKTTVASEVTAQEPINNITMKKTCTLIEESLLFRLPNDGSHINQEERITRAKIYAQLSERGCPENSSQYQELAKQELEIARALADDEFEDYETIEVVETYKRLNMQAAAEEIFETAKKLTNPAIDFILEVEKIINEK